MLLDMDGTLLDLHYDNTVWNEQVPRAYARAHDLSLEAAKEVLLAHMRKIYGTIEFYSFDYWNEYTGLDLCEIHATHTHLVEYRPGALEFLRWLRANGKHTVLATNAHPDSVAIKDAVINIGTELDLIVSSQEVGAPKESLAYWQYLQEKSPFDIERTTFVDDNEPVLDAAAQYGIAHLWTIITPDSQRPGRAQLNYPSFDHFDEIYAAL